MAEHLPHVILTGASGYIGNQVFEALRARGFDITILSSSPDPSYDKVRHFTWRLGDVPPEEAFQSPNTNDSVLVHFAHDWTSKSDEVDDTNLDGAHHLFAAARENGCSRIVLASSVAAKFDALNAYGRNKARIENLLEDGRDIALRIGLVCGGSEQGQWASLCGIARRFSVLLLPGAENSVQPIMLNDVATATVNAITISVPKKPPIAVCGTPIPFGRFLKIVRASRYGGRLRILGLPNLFLRSAIFVFEILPKAVRPDTERLRGLLGIPTIPWESDARALGIKNRSVSEMTSMQHRPHFGAIREGATVLSYVLRRRASGSLIRRYARAIGHHDGIEVMGFGAIQRRLPWTVAFEEPISPRTELSSLRTRIVFAASLSMVDEVNSREEITDPKTAISVVSKLVRVGIFEFLAFPFRAMFSRRHL